MRRSEKEVIDNVKIEEILNRAEVCRLAMSVDDVPYLVPMNFGYSDKSLYFHCAKEGRKLTMIKENPNICFEVEESTEVIDGGDIACQWSMAFTSIIGSGQARIIEDPVEKVDALNIIMNKFVKDKKFEYSEQHIKAVTVFEVKITEMTCKKNGVG